MKDFGLFLRDWKTLAGWLLKGILVLPILALLPDIVPPWPTTATIAGLSILAEAMLLMFAYEMWKATSVGRLRNRMRISLGSAMLFGVGYLFLWSVFTTDTVGGERILRGYVRTDEAVRLLAATGWSERTALENARFDPSRLWTRESLAVVGIGLVGSWLVLMASLCGVVASFSLLRRKRDGGRTAPKPRPPRARAEGTPAP